MGNGKGDVYLIIYTRGRVERRGHSHGVFFCLQGKKFFLTGEKNEKGEWGGEGRLDKNIKKDKLSSCLLL